MFGSGSAAVAFVYVVDRGRAVAFYHDTLGLPLLGSDEHGDLFAVGDARLRLTVIPDFKAGEHPVIGWEVADLPAAVEALAARGIPLIVYPGFGQDERGVWTSPDGGTRLGWFADPDGNILMLTSTD